MGALAGQQISINFLEIERERLRRILEDNNFDLKKPEVIEASQRMDVILLSCCREHGINKRRKKR